MFIDHIELGGVPVALDIEVGRVGTLISVKMGRYTPRLNAEHYWVDITDMVIADKNLWDMCVKAWEDNQ